MFCKQKIVLLVLFLTASLCTLCFVCNYRFNILRAWYSFRLDKEVGSGREKYLVLLSEMGEEGVALRAPMRWPPRSVARSLARRPGRPALR